MKKLLLILISLIVQQGWSQCTNSVSPSSATVSCSNGGTNVSFTATAINPNTNIRHDWFSPLNPNGSPVYTSTTAISVLNGRYSPGTYTVVTTDLSNMCTASQTIMIARQTPTLDHFPEFSVALSSTSVGCAGNQTTISIINPVSTQTPPSTCSYTFLPPGFVGSLIPNIALDPNNSATVVNVPGTYSVIVNDNSNFCRTMIPIQLYPSSTSISFNHTVMPGGVVNFQSTSTGTNGGTTFTWDFGDGTTGSGLSTSHTYSNGGTHNVTLYSSNPSCYSNAMPVNVNTIPCTANSNFTLVYSGTPQNWFAYPAYYGNVTSAVWAWGDGNSDAMLYPTHTYSAAGNYNICLSVTVTCAASSSSCAGYNIYRSYEYNPDIAMVKVSVMNTQPTGLKNIEADDLKFSAFPNPVDDILNIQLVDQQGARIEIYNIIGALVMEEELMSETITLNISNLPDGVYNLKLISKEGQVGVKRLILSR